MTTPKTPTPADGATPPQCQYADWSNLPEPEPVEDGMRQIPTIRQLEPLIVTHFRNRPDALIVRWVFLCWDPYDYDAKLAPDWIIAFGIDVAACIPDNGYLTWRVGKPPDVIIEIATPSTAAEDLGAKRDIYAQIQVPEYWRLDPSGGVLYGDPLVGEQLVDGEYRRFALYEDAEDRVLSHSPAMNIDLYWDGATFGIYDPVTGEYPLGLLDTRRERQAIERALAETRAIREQERQAARRALAQERAVYERELQAYQQTGVTPLRAAFDRARAQQPPPQ